MKLIKGKKEEVEKKAVKIIADKLASMEKTVFGIPGGNSAKGIFEKLKESSINWEKVHLFFVDERFVDLNDKESNYKNAMNSFLQELIDKNKIPTKNVHAFNHEKGIESYEKEFLSVSNKFGMAILGVGEDGHIASLFPNHKSLEQKGVFIKVENSPKPPSSRISASRSLLEKTDVAILLFFGEGKRKALEMFLDPSVSYKKCPAKIALNARECFVLTDIKI